MADTNEFIGVLAKALHTYEVQIRLGTLEKILHDNGSLAYLVDMDIVRIVADAYRYWAQRNPQTATAIAYAFTGEHGEASVTVTGASEQHTEACHSRGAHAAIQHPDLLPSIPG